MPGQTIDLTGPESSTTVPPTKTVLHPPPDTTPNPRKRRHKVDGNERLLIRQRYQENPGEGQQGVVDWFWIKYQRKIDQTVVSKSCSEKYAFLDTVRSYSSKLAKSRIRVADCPEVENILFDWQQRMQQKKIPINGDLLKEKASEIWNLIPRTKT